jgi:hypothetical protein
MTGTTPGAFGGGDLKLASRRFDVSDDVDEPKGLATRCRANDVEIAIETASGAHNPYGTYTFQRRDDTLPIPLGSGWSGFLVAEQEDQLGISVLLDCPNWNRTHGSGILVTAETEVADSGSASARTAITRLATQTAGKTAEKTGCEAKPGSPISRVDSLTTTEDKPADQAKGTCEGAQSRERARETSAGIAPVEYCVLESGLRLRADYGPFSVNHGRGGPYGGADEPAGISSMSSSISRNDSGKRWYSHTQWEMTSTGYRCPLYDSDALPTDDPSQVHQPEDHPTGQPT